MTAKVDISNLKIESLPNEEWRDVVGYEGLYMVSNLGIVKRLSMIKNNKKYSEIILSASMDSKHGYLSVSISGKNIKLHRIIASAFIPNPENKKQVNHKNGIRNDNRIDNLEWKNSNENIQHSVKYLRGGYLKENVDLSLNEKYYKNSVDSLHGEIWRDVLNFEGLYMISNLGRVKTVSRSFKNINNKTRTIREKLIKPQYSKGYLQVLLFIKGKSYTNHIHRLIAQSFIPNPENKPQVNHKNGKRDDFRIENLEWVTCSENMTHSYRTLKRKISGCYGINTKNRKKVAQYDLGGNLINTFLSLAEAGSFFCKNPVPISFACNSYQKRGHVSNCYGFMFRFFEQEPEIKINQYEKQKKFIVSVFDLKSNQFLYSVNSVSELAIKLNTDASSIHKVIKGSKKSHLGYYFTKQKI